MFLFVDILECSCGIYGLCLMDFIYLFILKFFFIEVWFLVMFVINFLWLYVGGEERMKLMMGQWDDPADPLLWDVPH